MVGNWNDAICIISQVRLDVLNTSFIYILLLLENPIAFLCWTGFIYNTHVCAKYLGELIISVK